MTLLLLLLLAPDFAVRDNRVTLSADSVQVLSSPAEGLWSIACDWTEGWPSGWQHAAPAKFERSGEWTVLHGELNACGGVWRLRDSYRMERGLLRGTRRFTWTGETVAPRVTLSVRFATLPARADALLPGILYYGNPNGARSQRVPVSSEESIFEEHRYPAPFASLELTAGDRLWGAVLHTLPAPAPYGNLPDQWWSLGVRRDELVLLSGPCAANGRRSVIKGEQAGFIPYDNAYLNVAPGAVIDKTFYLDAYAVAKPGTAFQRALRSSMDLNAPFDTSGLPDIASIVRDKWRYAKTRWREEPGYTGFQKYETREAIVMGWTGQAEAPGYALQVLDKGLNDPQALPMAQRSLDYLAGATFYESGFHNWFERPKGAWSANEYLNQGQAMMAFYRAIEQGRRRGLKTAAWEAFLRKAAQVHATRILDDGWRPVSTNEAVFIGPLIRASVLYKDATLRRAALKAASHYAARHLSMRDPYWGGTLDARCEDKEAAAAAFQNFLELYEVTRSPEHLDWARHACDVMMTYTMLWDIDLPPGRLRDHNVKTRGWTSVSVQNMHLDVWGAITAPDVYRLGVLDNREDLKRLALVMYRSAGQLIDAYGSQGEQLQQTNYAQRGRSLPLRDLRGGYHEEWTVFWITAHFLTGAARFAELGLDIWKE